MFVGDSIVRKTDRAINKGTRGFAFQGQKIEVITERVEKSWVQAREVLF